MHLYCRTRNINWACEVQWQWHYKLLLTTHVQGQQRPMQNRHIRDIISCCRIYVLWHHRRLWNRHVQGAHGTDAFRGNIGCYTVEQTPPGAAKADVEQTLSGATLADVEQTRHGEHRLLWNRHVKEQHRLPRTDPSRERAACCRTLKFRGSTGCRT
jgi:hypothetical protein